MRHPIIGSLAAVIGLGLAACQTTGTTITFSPQAVQAAVLAGCSYQVPAEEIAGLLATGNPAITTVSAAAQIICAAAAGTTITPAPAPVIGPAPTPATVVAKTARRTTVVVYGVTLHATKR
jgi:hypothetical protein